MSFEVRAARPKGIQKRRPERRGGKHAQSDDALRQSAKRVGARASKVLLSTLALLQPRLAAWRLVERLGPRVEATSSRCGREMITRARANFLGQA